MFWKKSAIKVVPIKAKLLLAGVFIVTMILNGLAGSTTLLGGKNTGEVSDSYPNLFAPAGVTFSIWGVIYILLLGFVVYTFLYKEKKGSKIDVATYTQIAQIATLNLAFNSAWLLAWQFEILWLSIFLMLGILSTLIFIVLKVFRIADLSTKEYVLVKLPFSIYLGWISVATIANVTIFLVSLGWMGGVLSGGTWMVGILMVAAVIAITATLRLKDAAYIAVFIWAFAGILLKHLAPEAFDGKYPSTIITLTILLAVFISIFVQLLAEKTTNFKSSLK